MTRIEIGVPSLQSNPVPPPRPPFRYRQTPHGVPRILGVGGLRQAVRGSILDKVRECHARLQDLQQQFRS